MVLESGTRMAVKPGCFAIRRDQNLSPNQQLLEGAIPETTFIGADLLVCQAGLMPPCNVTTIELGIILAAAASALKFFSGAESLDFIQSPLCRYSSVE